MADVTGRADRAQLILVGALALALLFVGLALVLNSAIYTENLATRSEQTETTDALVFRTTAATGAGEGIEHTNRQAYTASYADFPADLDDNVSAALEEERRLLARNGKVVSVSRDGAIVHGTRVAQDDGTTFEPQSPDVIGLSDIDVQIAVDHWQVASNVTHQRAYRMDVETASLAVFPQSEVETDLQNLEDSGVVGSDLPFTVAFDDEGGNIPDHAFSIYRSDADTDDVKLTYANLDTNTVDTCTIENAPATLQVDVTGYTVVGAGNDCHSVLEFFGELTGPYDMYYAASDNVQGEYSFVVKQEYANFKGNVTTLTSPVTGTTYNFPDDGDPRTGAYASAAVYAADFDVSYEARTLEYVSQITVAPGEPADA